MIWICKNQNKLKRCHKIVRSIRRGRAYRVKRMTNMKIPTDLYGVWELDRKITDSPTVVITHYELERFFRRFL